MGYNKRNMRVIRLSRSYYYLQCHYEHLRRAIRTLSKLSLVSLNFPPCYMGFSFKLYPWLENFRAKSPSMCGTYPFQHYIKYPPGIISNSRNDSVNHCDFMCLPLPPIHQCFVVCHSVLTLQYLLPSLFFSGRILDLCNDIEQQQLIQIASNKVLARI